MKLQAGMPVPQNENGLARFCLFKAIPVDGCGHAWLRRRQYAYDHRLSGGDEIYH
jgi:hypothetical protein